MKRTLLLSALAASLVAGSAAVAQEAPANGAPPAAAEGGKNGKMMRGMGRLDADGDGSISFEELSGARLERLKGADADGDGTLSAVELQDHIAKREAERKARRAARMLDVDGDGTVTLAEIENQQKKRFALMDANDDGKLDQREMRRGARQMAGEHGGRHGRHGKMRDHRGGPRGDRN
ncbi:EF-hand domain-containing protein [Nitratireductor pacificus]|uniref:Acid-shock protein n=1 Tax=Nitratireductor pacificus pht-3B TaxID=391937 RepID=K2MU37_9HYPH|nr:acid-shock protein [Nitratireductor pacificus]EKF20917.1 acid-shock protein [Nitratireductor pacificus pht-3B]